jgi:hypothetical protein
MTAGVDCWLIGFCSAGVIHWSKFGRSAALSASASWVNGGGTWLVRDVCASSPRSSLRRPPLGMAKKRVPFQTSQ